MHRLVVIVIAVMLVACDTSPSLLKPSFSGGGGTSPSSSPSTHSMLYNGKTSAGDYRIGLARSADGGETWAADVRNPVLDVGPSGSWDDEFVVDPCVVWDGSQWVMFYAGFDGTRFSIGRAMSSDLVTWSKYAGNPVLSAGGSGNFDDSSVNFPTVFYDPGAAPAWQMWYTAWPDSGAQNTSIGYARSADGLSWTRVSQVIAAGAPGAFDAGGMVTGPVVKVGSTYYVYYGGYDGRRYHSAYATTIDPADVDEYAKHGVLSGFSGALDVGGVKYQSNQLRALVTRSDTYLGYFTVFHSGDGTEAMGYTSTTDMSTFSTPLSGPLITLGSGWDSVSAENPWVIPARSGPTP